MDVNSYLKTTTTSGINNTSGIKQLLFYKIEMKEQERRRNQVHKTYKYNQVERDGIKRKKKNQFFLTSYWFQYSRRYSRSLFNQV